MEYTIKTQQRSYLILTNFPKPLISNIKKDIIPRFNISKTDNGFISMLDKEYINADSESPYGTSYLSRIEFETNKEINDVVEEITNISLLELNKYISADLPDYISKHTTVDGKGLYPRIILTNPL